MMLRIGFDISPITRTRTGVGNYCFYLLQQLVALGGAEYRGLATTMARLDLGPLANAIRHIHVPLPTRAMYAWWNTVGMPTADRLLGGVDVYHATNFYVPPVLRAKRIVTIHDLAFLARPETCSPKIVGLFTKGIRRFARQADAILVGSEATKQDIVRFLEVSATTVTVAPIAPREGLAPMDHAEARAQIAERYKISQPFLLFVSTLEPRKNVPGLLRVFAKIKDQIPHNLVLIGPLGWNTDAIFATITQLHLEDRVVRPGFVSDLSPFYSAADAFVFPSLYEGFGMPVLEAMTCGCPVITSDNSSLPEVTGGAALMSNAEDDDAIAANILRVLGDAALRDDLVRRAHTHAARFSWRACAEKTLAVYRELAER